MRRAHDIITSTRRCTWLSIVAGLIASCSDRGVGPAPSGRAYIALEIVVEGLTSPVYLTAPPGDADRLFVVERGGLVRVIMNGSLLPTPFLDLTSLVSAGGERGLLSMAFHPAYGVNGHFYVDYTDGAGDTHVVRYTVSADPALADQASAFPILSVHQPYANHNGGLITFDPDGMLYVGLGDGGSAGDPDGNGQNPATLLGSLLRLDVDGGEPYAIPSDNPLVEEPSARHEVWAYGLRNPWRFSFDRLTGDLYIADVGQNAREEVSFQSASAAGGENYGWNVMEGTGCYSPPTGCSSTGLTLPVYEYSHGEGCSITGGYVYRGSRFPALSGRYFFADYCNAWVRSFRVVDGAVVELQDHSDDVGALSAVSSFGEDAAGELYVVSLGGTVYRVTSPP